MDQFQAALLAGAVLAALIAWKVPNALLWIACGAASFAASTVWQRYGLPHRAAFGAFTDVAICVALYFLARRRWEMRVWNCFMLMILLDILYMAGAIKSHYALIVGLEVANWLALLVIAGAGFVQRTGYDHSVDMLDDRWAGAVYRALYTPRRDHPFRWRQQQR